MPDHSKSLAILQKDRKLAPLVKKYGPPTLRRVGNTFQALVRAIIHQQVSGPAARTIHARFLALFPKGRSPSPAAVLKIPLGKMHAAGLSRQKASYIKDLAEKFSNGTVKYRSLHRMTSDELVSHLTQVKGIGVWSVHMFLIFTLNRPDVLPTGDLGIRKGFQIVYGLKGLPERSQMEELAVSWRKYASYASWYLWRAADAAKEKVRVNRRAER